MNTSIKRFLLFYITLSIVIIYGLISVVSYTISKDELDELYDANLQQVAHIIAARNLAMTGNRLPNDITQVDRQITGEEEFYVRVLNDSGEILYVSHPTATLPTPTTYGFSNHKLSYKKWRFYSIKSNQETIQVAQSLNHRKKTITDTAMSLMASQLLFIPVLVIVIFFAIRKALNPLSDLSDAIKNRQSTELTSFTSEKAPTEIRPLIDALNMFMGRVSDMIEFIKRFTSDAAHELRTPITALKLQLTLIEQAKNKAEREQAINNLRNGIDRSEQLVSQLLTLARIEPNNHARELETIDLFSLVKESIEALLPFALAKNIDLGMNTSLIAKITGVRHEIKILVNNIMDNAIRYTPGKGKIDISILSNHQNVILEVNDSGPGIAQADIDHVFERFYRGQNKDSKGSGLGLSIVKEIADQHHANLEIQNLNPGLLLRVYFPLI